MLTNNTLVNIVAFGDLLIGVYLIVLSVYDSIVFGKEFCSHQADWFTGTACSVLGVISTLGSQLSLFAMTVLSVIRAYGIVHSQIRLSFEVDKKAIIKTTLVGLGVVTVSVAIAVIPLIPFLEDYFVQGMYYDPNYKVFIGFPNKARHFNIIEAYLNDKHSNINARKNMTWAEIGAYVDSMFSRQYGNIQRKAVHFYGNDGVCLFKYFVRRDDARRSRSDSERDITDEKGDSIVWLMLGVNMACFIVIAVCYALISTKARTSAERSGSNQNSHIKRESKTMQRKITFIIVTDFLCWVPFIVVSALHNLMVIDASHWYASFAMIVVPLNSVINPLIYDNRFKKVITHKMKLLVTLVSGFRIFVQIRQRWQGREDRANVEIEMQPVQNLTRLQGAIDPAECQTQSDIIHVSIAQTSDFNTSIQPACTNRTGEKHNDNQLDST